MSGNVADLSREAAEWLGDDPNTDYSIDAGFCLLLLECERRGWEVWVSTYVDRGYGTRDRKRLCSMVSEGGHRERVFAATIHEATLRAFVAMIRALAPPTAETTNHG